MNKVGSVTDSSSTVFSLERKILVQYFTGTKPKGLKYYLDPFNLLTFIIEGEAKVTQPLMRHSISNT